MKRAVAIIAWLVIGAGCGKTTSGGEGGQGSGGTVADSGGSATTGGATSTGGSVGGGGSVGSGGGVGAGGRAGTGGGVGTGGSARSGGATGAGGGVGAGGTTGSPGAGGTTVGTGGGTPGTGGLVSAGGATVPAGGSGGTSSGSTTGTLLDRLSVSDVTVPAAVKPGRSNWRIWGTASLNISPVYTVPLADCGSLVCITTGTADSRTALGTSHAYAIKLDASDRLVTAFDLGAYECRGLAAEPDGHFAALLWAASKTVDCADPTVNGHIYVSRFDATGAAGWSTELTNTSGSDINCPTDFGLGESRMEFGGSTYGAYYHVHSQSGHEGDTLKYVDLTGKSSTTWTWGCSHSMSNLLRYNANDKKFAPVCATDCYPGTSGSDFATTSIGGVYTNNRNKIIDVDAGCNGSMAGELGGAALAPSGFKVVFNAHQAPATLGQSSYDKTTMNQDIGFASFGSGLTLSGAVVWLTTTASINEADSGIERWTPSDDPAEQYVAGWSEPGTSYVYRLGRVDASGKFLEGPIDVTAKAKWGRRDDPFRAHTNGDVVWAWFDTPSATTMHFARLRSGGTATCAAF
jgi:hypothetical protein